MAPKQKIVNSAAMCYDLRVLFPMNIEHSTNVLKYFIYDRLDMRSVENCILRGVREQKLVYSIATLAVPAVNTNFLIYFGMRTKNYTPLGFPLSFFSLG